MRRGVQVGCPVPAAKPSDCVHGAQAVAPDALAKVPAGHGVQTVAPAPPMYQPGAHGAQLGEPPRAANVPARHAAHCCIVPLVKEPASHDWHTTPCTP